MDLSPYKEGIANRSSLLNYHIKSLETNEDPRRPSYESLGSPLSMERLAFALFVSQLLVFDDGIQR